MPTASRLSAASATDSGEATALAAEVVAPSSPTELEQAALHNAAELAASHGVGATTALLGGSTAEEIVRYGDAKGVDLIVVGSSARGALTGALFGSVSHDALRKSTRPVAGVRGGMTTPV